MLFWQNYSPPILLREHCRVDILLVNLHTSIDRKTFHCLALHIFQPWAGEKWKTRSLFPETLKNFEFLRFSKLGIELSSPRFLY